MAVQLTREGMISLFIQLRQPTGFLQRLFTFKPGSVYSGNKVFIDIKRIGEDVAIPVEVCTGPNFNTVEKFTTKEMVPPQYGEAFPVDACELLDRMAGVDPYSAAYMDDASMLTSMLLERWAVIDAKIVRGMELQASQILQTGKLDLLDGSGSSRYKIDFLPKAAHFPTVGTPWSNAAATPLADLQALANVLRANGKVDPNRLIMGETALSEFLANQTVKDALDNRRIEVGEVAPEMSDSGATFYGYVWVGTYRMEIWAYPEGYEDPQTGNFTKYVDDGKVVMLSTRTRLDKTSAKVPRPLVAPDPRVAGMIPGRLTSRDDGFDVTPNLYPSANGKQLIGELESRPLLVPAQIDGFGCLTT